MDASIIITNYNYGLFLERCIRSCLNQKMPLGKEYEIIVIDDNSNDMSHEILKRFQGKIRYKVLDDNYGVAFASNVGIRMSDGRFVVRVDSDDYINEYMLLIQLLYLSYRTDYFGVSVDYYTVDLTGDKKIKIFSANDEPISCGIMYRKDLLVLEGLYDPNYRHREERELRLRLREKYTIGNIPIPLYRYRIHGENKTNDIKELKRIDNYLTKKYRSGSE
jgi:glycosyltransferase involved in cell wall biosynthesis|tara:strand:- start:216 stop:875 length:660 start_codon:yes stop_codon:yes gene_type:complete